MLLIDKYSHCPHFSAGNRLVFKKRKNAWNKGGKSSTRKSGENRRQGSRGKKASKYGM